MKLILGLLIVAAANGDTLYMRDGRTVSGTFLSGNSREVRFLADGGTAQRHSISMVDRVSFGASDSVSSSSTAVSASNTGATRTGAGRNRAGANTVPAGTKVTVRLIDSIDSDKTGEGQTYKASMDEDWIVDGRTIASKGADATVKVVRVNQSGTLSGREEIAVVLSEIDANGRKYIVDTNHAELSAKSRKDESVKIVGGSAVVGAIIGAIAGGGKGAAIGAATGAGAGAAVQAIRGQQVKIPSETKLDFTLAQPLRF